MGKILLQLILLSNLFFKNEFKSFSRIKVFNHRFLFFVEFMAFLFSNIFPKPTYWISPSKDRKPLGVLVEHSKSL